MAIRIDTQVYELTHGKAPRGRGAWQFAQEATLRAFRDYGKPAVTVLTAPSDMSYREACAWARENVRRRGYQDATLHVKA